MGNFFYESFELSLLNPLGDFNAVFDPALGLRQGLLYCYF